uniref:Putative ixoderin b5 n=1 Tax=Ixodes ricinus TaxID=34613 RepID=A0A6B0V7T5_IXORI
MFVAFLFIPVVAGNVFMESSFRRVPEITERQHGPRKTYMLFDPCNTNKPGNRTISCSQIKMRERSSKNKEYEIYPLSSPLNATCDMESDGGGWTVIQRRTSKENREDLFEKNLKDYERGFETNGGGFWIGNEILHALTSFPNNQQALRIELTRTGAKKPIVVLYHKFHVGSKNEGYKLTINDYQGPEGTDYDALSYHNGEKFTIKEGTKDIRDDSCSSRLSGGWWFKKCNKSNLNGRKFARESTLRALGITWHIGGKSESYKYTYDRVEMKIRDADFGFCTGSRKS